MIDLILGGARSGKSRLAEQRALNSGLPVTYVATATAGDDEMSDRIRHHRERRPAHWQLIEEPLQLAECLTPGAASNSAAPHCFLVDCLTLWVSNWLLQEDAKGFRKARNELLQQLQKTPHHIILVSNETGMGIVPMGSLSRDFVDESGRLHQDIAALADNVILTVAGLPLPVKRNGQPCFDFL